jgi:DNA-binding NarL/FixJ family response regulator
LLRPEGGFDAEFDWGTPGENAQDTIRHGRTLRGRKNPNAKMTERSVMAARLLSEDGFSHIAIGEFLGVSPGTVDRAVSGEQWGHVDE